MNRKLNFNSAQATDAIGTALRVFIGCYVMMAALPKIDAPYEFATNIAHYNLLPTVLVNGFALVIPWVELFLAVMLIVGVRIKTASLFTGLLLVLFTGAVAIAVANNLEIDCGCFGEGSSETVSWTKVLKNALLILGCAWLYIRPRTMLDMVWFSERKLAQ